MRTPEADTVRREDTWFVSDGARCAAWHYRAGSAPAPVCIVMAHGFGATRHYGLDAFARRFAAHGHDAFVFDYRHFGESDGTPRGLIEVSRQLADWRAAIAHARALGYGRIVLWGTSFAGGHVLRVAADDRDFWAAIAQVPHVSGPATARAVPLRALPRLVWAMVRDAASRLFGRRSCIPAVGPPGSVAAMATPGAYDALLRMLPRRPDGGPDPAWRAYFDTRNRVPALALAAPLFYSPGRRAARIGCPVLIQAARRDATTPFAAARAVAARIPGCTFRAYDADHFDVYLPPAFERVVREQVAFLARLAGGEPAPAAHEQEAMP